MSKTLITLSLLWMLSPLFAESKSQSAIQAFNEGVQRVNASKFNEAVPFFDQAIGRDETFAEAYYARAVCKYRTKNAEGAIADLNRAAQLKSEYLEAHALRGAVLYEQERWDAAYQDFGYILQRNPQDAQALLGRGMIALRREDLTTARQDLALFVKLKPNDPLAPQLRKFLASFRESAPAESQERAAYGSPSAGKKSSQDSDRMIQELLRNAQRMSESETQKVYQPGQTQTQDAPQHRSAPQ